MANNCCYTPPAKRSITFTNTLISLVSDDDTISVMYTEQCSPELLRSRSLRGHYGKVSYHSMPSCDSTVIAVTAVDMIISCAWCT